MDNYEFGITFFNSSNLTAKLRRIILKICKDLEPFTEKTRHFTENVFQFQLSIIDFDNWFPFIENEKLPTDHFSAYILLKKDSAPILNLMGFTVYSNDQILNDIFKKYKNLDRNKSNYMNFQSELLESGFGNSATFDFENIQKLDKLYEISKN